jgi:CDP-glucose 4,6-dehydratase
VLEDLEGYLLLARELYEGKKDFSGSWNFGPDNSENCLTVEEVAKKSFKILKEGGYMVKKDFIKHEAGILKLNIEKAKRELKWTPRLDIDGTLESTFDWYKNFYEKKDCVEFTDKQIKSFFEKR